MLFLHNTSRVDDEPYPKLLQEKGFSGFPSLCYMDEGGNVLGQPKARSVAAFEEGRVQSHELLELRAKAAGGDPELRRKLLLTELDMGLIQGVAELDRRVAEVTGLTEEDTKTVAQQRTDLEVRGLQMQVRELGPEKVAERMAAIAAAGRTPSERMAPGFWIQVLTHARSAKDGALAEQAFAALEARFGNDQRMKPRLESWKKMVEEAKGK